MEVLVYGKYCNSNDMDAMETVHHTYTMNETPRRRITVTSSLNEISTDEPGKS